MKMFYSILFLGFVIFSCNRKQENMHLVSNNNDTVFPDSTKIFKDTIFDPPKTKDDYGTISGISHYEFPRDKKQLNDWRRKVLEKGDSYYYGQLSNYYYQKNNSEDDMIELTQAMIEKNKSKNNYKTLYYYYVKRSKPSNKNKYIKKAIKYLNQSIKEVDNIMSRAVARRHLSEIYREGIYVKEDTVIANYLYNGGCNIDSIIQARKAKNK